MKFLNSVVDKRCNACEEKRTKLFDLLESMQNLILMVSSVDSDCIPNKPTILCRDFYTERLLPKPKPSSAKCSRQQDVLCLLTVAASLPSSPAPFCAMSETFQIFFVFLVPVAQPNAPLLHMQSMMLQVKVSHSQGWSEKDFKDTAKQGIQAPNLADNLVY